MIIKISEGGINNLTVVESCGIKTTGIRSKEAVIKSHRRKLIAKLTSLKTQKKRLEDKQYQQQCEEHRKLHNIEWETAMRGYHCMRRIFHSDETRNKIMNVDKNINTIKNELEAMQK